MAVRGRLHKNHLSAFSTWLLTDGWNLEDPIGAYVVLRARKEHRFMVIYSKHDSDHLSYEDKHNRLISQFLREVTL